MDITDPKRNIETNGNFIDRSIFIWFVKDFFFFAFNHEYMHFFIALARDTLGYATNTVRWRNTTEDVDKIIILFIFHELILNASKEMYLLFTRLFRSTNIPSNLQFLSMESKFYVFIILLSNFFIQIFQC